MKIYVNSSYNGSSIAGDCVMLRRDGRVYPCIDNLYHPNPGTEDDEYSEIERPVDWLLRHGLEILAVRRWMQARMRDILEEDPNAYLADIVPDIMYNDSYAISGDTEDLLAELYEEYQDPETRYRFAGIDEIEEARDIAKYINENFLRIRAGGKLNPEGTDTIYFRISSHGYNWRRQIENFLWDTFGDPDKMPKRIWIGHDAETNPPEITLFDGTPYEFIEQFDDKIAASTKVPMRLS